MFTYHNDTALYEHDFDNTTSGMQFKLVVDAREMAHRTRAILKTRTGLRRPTDLRPGIGGAEPCDSAPQAATDGQPVL